MQQPITQIRAKNFRSLADVRVPLAPLTVLVGPNGSGKSNVLNVLRFLASTVRLDLPAALQQWNGFDHVQRQAGAPGRVLLEVQGHVTTNSGPNAPDEYSLTISRTPRTGALSRKENFTFKRSAGRGRRLTVSGTTVTIADGQGIAERQIRLASSQTTGLATLPKLADEAGGEGIRQFTDFLTGIRVFEPNVELAEDASNLGDALARIRRLDQDAWMALGADVMACLPGLEAIDIVPVGGMTRAVAVQLRERGIPTPISLADASFGTVRLLAQPR